MGERLDRLDELERAGTPEPWAFRQHRLRHALAGRDGDLDWQFDGGQGEPVMSNLHSTKGLAPTAADAALTIEARNALRPLIDIARAARTLHATLAALPALPNGEVADLHAGLGVLLARLEGSNND